MPERVCLCFGLLGIGRADQTLCQKQHHGTACEVTEQKPQHANRSGGPQRVACRVTTDNVTNFMRQHTNNSFV